MKEIRNVLAGNINGTGEMARYDTACKHLLSHKIILAWIMKSCLEEYRDCDIKDIAEKYIEGEPEIAQVSVHVDEDAGEGRIKGSDTRDSTINEGTVVYDIRFHAIAPVSGEFMRLLINMEAQNEFYPGYPLIKRGIYYCGRMISSQHGTEFVKSHYEKIKKVYSIWICMNPPKNRENTINRYSITEENIVGDAKEEIKNYDLLTAVMICLGKPGGDNYSGILKLLEVLLSSKRSADEKKKILQKDFSIKMTEKLESEVRDMCNLSQGIVDQGIARGITEGVFNSIKNLMDSMKWTSEQAMDALKIPEAERDKYRKTLEKP